MRIFIWKLFWNGNFLCSIAGIVCFLPVILFSRCHYPSWDLFHTRTNDWNVHLFHNQHSDVIQWGKNFSPLLQKSKHFPIRNFSWIFFLSRFYVGSFLFKIFSRQFNINVKKHTTKLSHYVEDCIKWATAMKLSEFCILKRCWMKNRPK